MLTPFFTRHWSQKKLAQDTFLSGNRQLALETPGVCSDEAFRPSFFWVFGLVVGATVDGSEIPNNHLWDVKKTLWKMGYTTNLNWWSPDLSHQRCYLCYFIWECTWIETVGAFFHGTWDWFVTVKHVTIWRNMCGLLVRTSVFYCGSENSNKIIIALVRLAQNTSTNTSDSWDRSRPGTCSFPKSTTRNG